MTDYMTIAIGDCCCHSTQRVGASIMVLDNCVSFERKPPGVNKRSKQIIEFHHCLLHASCIPCQDRGSMGRLMISCKNSCFYIDSSWIISRNHTSLANNYDVPLSSLAGKGCISDADANDGKIQRVLTYVLHAALLTLSSHLPGTSHINPSWGRCSFHTLPMKPPCIIEAARTGSLSTYDNM